MESLELAAGFPQASGRPGQSTLKGDDPTLIPTPPLDTPRPRHCVPQPGCESGSAGSGRQQPESQTWGVPQSAGEAADAKR